MQLRSVVGASAGARCRLAGVRAAALSAGLLLVALACEPQPVAEGGPGAADLHAEIHTNRGTILARLEPERASLATASFVGLAEGTIANDAFPVGRPFYDGTVFHRVVPGHVVQAGAPDTPDAGGPGYTFPNEIHADLSHDRAGVLGVANSGPHTNSSQFYITLGDRSYLDGSYIVFGEVLDGMEVVNAIREGDVVDSVRIVRAGPRAEAFHPETESFERMVELAELRVLELERERVRAQEEWIARNLPPLEGEPARVRTARMAEPVAQDAPGDMLEARYTGTALRFRGHLVGHEGPPIDALRFGSGEEGQPGFHDPPRRFPVPSDERSLPAGLRGALLEMTPGERWWVVVPAPLGYGRSGFFAPERPGEPRFVIPPETMLVYELELLPR